MRILSWVQNKLNRGQEKKRVDAHSGLAHRTSIPDALKNEFSDWPQILLAIGTFGTELKQEPQRNDPTENSHSSQDLIDLSQEEAIKLQKELTKLLTCQPNSCTDRPEKGSDGAGLPLNRLLNTVNSTSNSEVDRTSCLKFPTNAGEDGDLSPISKIILSKARDILADRHNIIRERPISFLLKNMFACRSGFAPTPRLQDPIPESRTEKLLRAILHKKIYPRNSAAQSRKMEYLEQKQLEKTCAEDEVRERGEDGCKWVKTDSEYIVLEM